MHIHMMYDCTCNKANTGGRLQEDCLESAVCRCIVMQILHRQGLSPVHTACMQCTEIATAVAARRMCCAQALDVLPGTVTCDLSQARHELIGLLGC